MQGIPILSIVTFFPLIGVLLLFMIDKENARVLKGVAFVVSVINFIISLYVLYYFNDKTAAMQFTENYVWLEKLGVSYFVGIDGISLLLFLLTTFLVPICILCSWTYIEKHVREFLMFMLLLEIGMLGAFISLDMFLFYVFWELMLIPMYFIIGVWGGKRRIYAAVKFVLYTLFGSVLMLVAILVLYFYVGGKTGEYTFNLLKLYETVPPYELQIWLFSAFALSFAIKVPMFPLHTWLPDAHVEAPTAGSVILAGVLLKMGTYGFLRFAMGLFPNAAQAATPFIAVIAIIGIIYGALVAMMQPDVKKLVAYSSVSHLGAVMLGLFSFNVQGIEGGLYQMLSHGLSTGGLFIMIGMIYERRHTRMIADFGGLAKTVPVFAAFFMVVTLSSIGLPGLNGFIGEFLIFLGAFKANPTWAVFAASSVILSAAYMLWMYQRVMYGPITHEENKKIKDMNVREISLMVPIVILFFVMGIFPNYFLSKMHVSVNSFLDRYNKQITLNVDTRGVVNPNIKQGGN
jgi:NADH-quinone oxidoreductase subunit M